MLIGLRSLGLLRWLSWIPYDPRVAPPTVGQFLWHQSLSKKTPTGKSYWGLFLIGSLSSDNPSFYHVDTQTELSKDLDRVVWICNANPGKAEMCRSLEPSILLTVLAELRSPNQWEAQFDKTSLAALNEWYLRLSSGLQIHLYTWSCRQTQKHTTHTHILWNTRNGKIIWIKDYEEIDFISPRR